jgi:hypothetical protein
VTWLSTVGTGLISDVICSRMAFRQRGGEEAWTAADSERSRRRVVPTQLAARRPTAGCWTFWLVWGPAYAGDATITGEHCSALCSDGTKPDTSQVGWDAP